MRKIKSFLVAAVMMVTFSIGFAQDTPSVDPNNPPVVEQPTTPEESGTQIPAWYAVVSSILTLLLGYWGKKIPADKIEKGRDVAVTKIQQVNDLASHILVVIKKGSVSDPDVEAAVRQIKLIASKPD